MGLKIETKKLRIKFTCWGEVLEDKTWRRVDRVRTPNLIVWDKDDEGEDGDGGGG